MKAEQARAKAFSDAVTAGDTALTAGRPQDAVQSYTQALAYLPMTPPQRETFAAHWNQASFESELPVRTAKTDDSLTIDLTAAQSLLKTEQPAQALAAYVSLLGKYPVGQVGFSALAGIRQASAKLQEPSPQELAMKAELAKVKDQLASARLQLQESAKTASPTSASDPQAEALAAMKAQFQNFLTLDAPLWVQTPDSSKVLQSKLLFNDFLGSPEVSAAFPGLVDKVGRYEK